MFDLVCNAPDHWTGDKAPAPNSIAARSTHFLSQDFCVREGEDYFVRCVLMIPIIGSNGEEFAYGVWSSLSEQNFKLYVDAFDDDEREDLGPWFGWFSNQLKAYPDTLNLRCHVHPRTGGQRPLIELEPVDHPLVKEVREGVTLDRLLEIYALSGHDFRTALTD